MVQYVNEISEHKFRNKRLSLLVRFYERNYVFVSVQWHGENPYYSYGLAGSELFSAWEGVAPDVVARRWLLRLMRSHVDDFDQHLAECKAHIKDSRFHVLADLISSYGPLVWWSPAGHPYIKNNIYDFSVYFDPNDERKKRISQYWPQINGDNIPYYHEKGFGFVYVRNVCTPICIDDEGNDQCWPVEEIRELRPTVSIYEPSIERMLQFVDEISPEDATIIRQELSEKVRPDEHVLLKMSFLLDEQDSSWVFVQFASFPVKKAKQPNY